METLSIVLGFTAGTLQLVGYWVYNKSSDEKISTGSWSIWALAGIIDFVSYFVLTGGDWVVSFLPAVCGLAAFGIFVYAIVRKRFSWPDRIDWLFVGADGVITIVWYFTNVVVANLLYQASAVVSFVPMCRGLLSGREKEKPLPWFIWTLAYSLLTIAVSLRLQRWEELVYPLTHVTVHVVVAVIAIVKQRPSR